MNGCQKHTIQKALQLHCKGSKANLVPQPVGAAPEPSVIRQIQQVTLGSNGNILVIDEAVCHCLDDTGVHCINASKQLGLGDAAPVNQEMAADLFSNACSSHHANSERCRNRRPFKHQNLEGHAQQC